MCGPVICSDPPFDGMVKVGSDLRRDTYNPTMIERLQPPNIVTEDFPLSVPLSCRREEECL